MAFVVVASLAGVVAAIWGGLYVRQTLEPPEADVRPVESDDSNPPGHTPEG
ncbi:MAG: hypothetical protein ABEL76_08450 [Bradymonadaceae bacterium]